MPVQWGSGSFQAPAIKRRWPNIYPTGKPDRLPARDSLSLRTATPCGSLGKPMPTPAPKYNPGQRRVVANPCDACGLSIGELGDLVAKRCFRHRLDRQPPKCQPTD